MARRASPSMTVVIKTRKPSVRSVRVYRSLQSPLGDTYIGQHRGNCFDFQDDFLEQAGQYPDGHDKSRLRIDSCEEGWHRQPPPLRESVQVLAHDPSLQRPHEAKNEQGKSS